MPDLLEDEDGAPYPEAVQDVVRDRERAAREAGRREEQSLSMGTMNEIVAHAPETFDNDVAIDAIAIDYVRWLEGLVTGQSDPVEVCRVLREQVESELEGGDRGG